MKKEKICVIFSILLMMVALFCSPHFHSAQDGFYEGEKESSPVEKSGFVINLRSKKFHTEDCFWGSIISEKNEERYNGDRENLIEKGFSPCKRCNP